MKHEPHIDYDHEDLDRIYDEFGALLNEREAADLLGAPVRTLQSWRHAGTGPPYVKLGEAPNAPVRYPAAKLRRFLQRHMVRTAGAGAMLGGLEAPEVPLRRPDASRGAPAPPASQPEERITLRTVKRLAEELAPAGLTEASIRWAIFHEETNGLKEAGAIVRPAGSRRVLIDREKYEQWLRGKSRLS